MTTKQNSRVTAVEIKFLRKSARKTKRGRCKSEEL